VCGGRAPRSSCEAAAAVGGFGGDRSYYGTQIRREARGSFAAEKVFFAFRSWTAAADLDVLRVSAAFVPCRFGLQKR
jgi:hypothetical protein